MLREILAQPQATAREEMGDAYSMKDGRHGSEDSGYFSRRGSKAVSTGDGKRDSVLTEEMEEIAEEIENNNDDDDDEISEEADDEGAGGEDLEQEEEGYNSLLLGLNDNNHLPHRKSIIAQRPQPHTHTHPPTPSASQHNQTPTPASEHRTQIQIGTRFISPRKPASPRLSADEATVAVAVAGSGRDPVG